MAYKISGTKSETARIIVLKETDWSIESNTVISGSGAYEIEDLETGNKLVFARNNDGWIEGFGAVVAEEYVPSGGDRGIFGGGNDGAITNTIEYIAISSTGVASDFGDLTVARRDLQATSNGVTGRGIFGGGYTSTFVSTIDYITILTPGAATAFGDLTYARVWPAATSNGTNDRGIFAGGAKLNGYVNIIDYVTISSASNADDFGDLSPESGIGRRYASGTSNGTNDRGVFLGGYTGTAYKNIIDYITISSTSNSFAFGDLLNTYPRSTGAVSNNTNNRGVVGGGTTTGTVRINVIEYITISSTGDATDFGDLIDTRGELAGCSNGISDRGVFGGGHDGSNPVNTMDYITISSTGDATDFGDLTVATQMISACSNA